MADKVFERDKKRDAKRPFWYRIRLLPYSLCSIVLSQT